MLRRFNLRFSVFDQERCEQSALDVANPFDTEQLVLCSLSFLQQGDEFTICLRDNGQASEIKEGNGISGLRERLAAIGATLTLQQQDGLTARIQLPRPESAQ